MLDMSKLVLLIGETRRGEDSDITNQGNIVGIRYQSISLPFIGMGPCQMINHSDVIITINLIYLANKEYLV